MRTGTGKGSRTRSRTSGFSSTNVTRLIRALATLAWDRCRSRALSRTHTSYSSKRLENRIPARAREAVLHQDACKHDRAV